jgi:hypothetical protein
VLPPTEATVLLKPKTFMKVRLQSGKTMSGMPAEQRSSLLNRAMHVSNSSSVG